MNLAWRHWLQQRVELRAVRSGRRGLEQFVASLQHQSDEDVAVIVVAAAAVRMRLREAGHLPDDVMHLAAEREYERATEQQRISRLVRRHQRRSEYIEAAGAMVWVHTLRSLTMPELHDLGMQMWQQLARAIPCSAEALARLESATHRPLPPGTLPACNFIPEDLRALESGGAQLRH